MVSFIGQINIDASAFARTLMDDPDDAAMRATLGLVIGTNVQAYHALLAALAALTTGADKGLYFTGSNAPATFDLTAAARGLLDDVDEAAMRTTLVLDIGNHVQPHRKQATVATDADFTLTPGTSAEMQRHTGSLTADRTITLGTGQNGDLFEITRTGAGAFSLSVGGLKSLATNAWCRVCHDGTGWYLAAAGTL